MGDKIKKRFSESLRRHLEEQNISQSHLAAQLGVSRAYVSSLTSGKKNASPARIDEIAKSIGLSEANSRKLHTAAAIDMGFKIQLPDNDDF